jgi:STE24 endopeptidase
MYDKKSPPAALAHKLDQETFEKSQRYGRDKAYFSVWSGLFFQVLETALLVLNFQPWAWSLAGQTLSSYGYADYEVRVLVPMVPFRELG